MREELDTAYPEDLLWLWEGAAVLHGLSAPRRASLETRANGGVKGGGKEELKSSGLLPRKCDVLLHPLRLPLPAPPASYRLPPTELVPRLPTGIARDESEWRSASGEGRRSSRAPVCCVVLLHPLRLPLPAPATSHRLPPTELVPRLRDGAVVHWRRGGDRWRRRRAPVRKPRATPPALPVPLRLDRSLAVLGAVAISCPRPTPSAALHCRQPASTERNRRRCWRPPKNPSQMTESISWKTMESCPLLVAFCECFAKR